MINEANVELGNDTAEVVNLQPLHNQLRMFTRELEAVNAETNPLIPKEALESELNVALGYEEIAVKSMPYLQEKIDRLTQESSRVSASSTSVQYRNFGIWIPWT